MLMWAVRRFGPAPCRGDDDADRIGRSGQHGREHVAEGLSILKHADAGLRPREVSAEVTPLRDAELYQYQLDIPAVTEVWRRGSVVASRLLDLAAEAFLRRGDLSDFEGRVSDSGEGRWTSIAAIDVGAPAPALTTALYERFTSRGDADFADRVLSAMRLGFGGHEEAKS